MRRDYQNEVRESAGLRARVNELALQNRRQRDQIAELTERNAVLTTMNICRTKELDYYVHQRNLLEQCMQRSGHGFTADSIIRIKQEGKC
jgi:hypothetical protein